MPYDAIHIRLLDLNGARQALTERRLRRMLRERGIEATVTCVGCGLEMARLGLADELPALLMNQYVASAGRELTDTALEAFLDRLELWRTREQRRHVKK